MDSTEDRGPASLSDEAFACSSLGQENAKKTSNPSVELDPLKQENHQILQLRIIIRSLDLIRRLTYLQALARVTPCCSRLLILTTVPQNLL